jgi:transcriptional regulator with GAF, ATPase, and Fis domain
MIKNNSEKFGSDKTPDDFIFAVEVMTKICSIKEANHIMSALVTELVARTNSDQGVISFIPDQRSGDLSTIIRVHSHNREDIPYIISTQILGWVLNNKSMLRIDDLDSDKRFREINSQKGKYKSILCYPMIVAGEIIGLMTLIRSNKKPPFEQKYYHLMEMLIPLSAQILANAKLLEELSKSNELLEISRQKLKQENIQLKSEISTNLAFENIIGKSSCMRKALTMASKYSVIDSPVLITGETGTGKDLIAKAIHFNSDRKNKPFVVINCGFKTETLLESELFGHFKGSFTGAIRNKIGLFKEADGGTIFLDEIGDAPLSIQSAILRVIQNGEMRPLGSTKTETVNVRVISATNKNLQEEIAAKRFREDLFYRLSTFMLELPPLRDRREDIPLLVNHFISKIKIKFNRDNLAISPQALDMLMKSKWAGNVRELESEIERAAVACSMDGIIDSTDLSTGLADHAADEVGLGELSGKIKDIVGNVEKTVIKKALAENKGNIFQTSKALGLTPKGLANKIKRYKIIVDYKTIVSG